jgi:hypothetical protein
MPSGVASLWDQIDRGPSSTLGRMKRQNVIALHFELRPRWQSRELLFGYRAASALVGADSLWLPSSGPGNKHVEEMTMNLSDDPMFERFSDFARHPEKQDAHMEALLGRIRERLPKIEELLVEIADHWGEEDGVYRFYHQSFKVFGLQQITKESFKLIEKIGGETDPLNGWYCQIVKEGTEGDFCDDTNAHWPEQTRPILEAFWHTKYFLAMMAKYGKELQSAPRVLPSGWASVLCLFSLR